MLCQHAGSLNYSESIVFPYWNVLKLAAVVIVILLSTVAHLQAQPAITSLSPAGAALGGPGFTLTVTGGNFSVGSVVRWNGSNRTTTRISDSELRATIPASDLAGFAPVSITVFSGQTSNIFIFPIYRQFPLATNDLIYDRFARRIYASVRGTTATGNSITPIDPFTGVLGSPIWIGSEPGKLAISDNGQYLYAALDGAAAVRRLDLATQTTGLQFWLGGDAFNGPNFVADMEVLPGNPSAVAVSWRYQNNNPNGAVAIYDDGVKRPVEVPRFNGADRLEFSSASSVLYGFDTQLGNDFLTMAVDASGVTVTNSSTNLVFGSDIEFDNGRIYSTFGSVLDPATLTHLGTFTAPGLAASTLAPDTLMDRVFFLSLTGSTAVVHAFDKLTFGLVGSMSVTVTGSQVRSLIRWDEDGLAFRTDSNEVYLLRIPQAWFTSGPALTVTPAGVAFPAQPVSTTSSALSLTVTNNTNASVVITGITSTGDFDQTNNCGSSLAAFAACTISVTSTPTMEGRRTGSLTIMDGSAGSPHIVGLSGIGNASLPVPSVTSISPFSAAAGSPGFTLTVTGGNFVATSVVRWNGVDRPTTFLNSSTLTTTIPASFLVGLESPTVTVFNPSPDGGLSNSAAFTIYRALTLTTKDLIYDRFGRKIYASIPGMRSGGNSIVPIDPFTATLGPPIWIGSEPGKLAVSDDGQYLYAMLDGAASIRRLHLASQTAGLQFSLGNNSITGPNYALDIEVMPGNPGSVAVTYGSTVGVFDEGVRRPAEAIAFPASDAIAFSNSPSTLYGSISGGLSFHTMTVDAGGVTVTNITGLLVKDIQFDDGRVYGSSGVVVDPLQRTLLGTFTSEFFGGVVVPESTLDRVFFLNVSGSTAVIHAFDRTKFTYVGSLSISGVPGGGLYSLIRWGADGLAFRAIATNQVFLIKIPRSWFISPPTLSVSPASFAFPAQPVGVTTASQPVLVTNNTSGAIPLQSIAVTGDFAQTNNCGTSIPAFATCTINVTFTPTMPGKRSGTLTILAASPGSPHIVGLAGIGNNSFPSPAIMSISPYSAPAGSAGFTLTVMGGNFVAQSVVRWNGIDRPTTFVDANTLSATISANNLAGLESAMVTVFNPAPDGGTSNIATFVVYRSLQLTTNDLIYNPFDRRIYASIPGNRSGGNSILAIDPVTTSLGPPVWIGSEPGKLAISDNGQYLYVSLDGAAAVRRMDLLSQTPGLQFSLGNDPTFGPFTAGDMEVLPGNPSAVAVARKTSSTAGIVAVYDDGIKRPAETPPFQENDAIAISNSSSTLYGADDSSVGSGLRTLSVDSGGVTITSVASIPVAQFRGDIKFESGRIYGTTGALVDPLSGTLDGKFTVPTIFVTTVIPDSTLDRVFFLSRSGIEASATIHVFNRADFTLVGNLTIFGVNGSIVNSLVRWGEDGLAFRTQENQVFLVRIPQAWFAASQSLSVSPPSFLYSTQAVGTTSAAQVVTLANNTMAPVAVTSITATGDFAQTNNCGSTIGALASCTVIVTFTPTQQGMRIGTVTIIAADPGSPHIVSLSGIGNTSMPVPSITSTNPSGAAMGSTGFTLGVSGNNFVPGSVVHWNGLNRTTTFISNTNLSALIPASDLINLSTAGITVVNPSPDGGVSNELAFTVYRVVTLVTKDLIYDRFGQKVYASIPGSAPNGNSITPIDPFTATTGSPVPIGMEPSKLALSDNGQFLYVAINGGGTIRRMNLATQTLGLQFSLGTDAFKNPYGAGDMEVMPGNSSTLAVARTYLNMSGSANVAIYDNGIKRSVETGNVGSLAVAFSNPSSIYGIDDSVYGFVSMAVDAAGVSVTNTTKALLPLSNDIKHDGGLIYSVTGPVVEPQTRTMTGTFNSPGPPFSESFALDGLSNLVFFLQQQFPTAVVKVFNRTNFALVGTLRIPGMSGFTLSSLVRWAEDGLAFRTADQVFLARIPATWFPPPVNKKRGQVTSQ